MKDAQTMTDEQITIEFHVTEAKWRVFQADLDEGYGGSPGEWMTERMGELETELRRRQRHCIWCLLPFGLTRVDGSKVEAKSPSACKRCHAENIAKEIRRG